MGDLATDTQVSPIERDPAEHPGVSLRLRANLSRDWEIWGPNGGYVAAVSLRAAGCAARIRRPATFHMHFLRVAEFGPVELDVTVVQAGRRAESIRVSMSQEGRLIVVGMLRTALAGDGLLHDTAVAPTVDPPEKLSTYAELYPDQAGPGYPFWNNVAAKPVEGARAASPPQGAPPVCRQWNRFVPRATFDDPFVDAARSLILLDTMGWPAATRLHVEPAYIAPSLDISAWFHRAAADEEWLLSDHDCPVGDSGLLGMNGRIWTRNGRLLATGAAQLMCVPAPPR